MITKNGKAAGVIVSPAEYDRIQYRQAFMESVARGVADGEAGRTKNTQDAKREIETIFESHRLLVEKKEK